MRVDNLILRLDGRAFEIFATDSDFQQRLHVDTVAFEAREPDRHGKVKVRIGLLHDGGLHLGAPRHGLTLDAAQFTRFKALVAAVKQAAAEGPEPW
jgi:hypothetical protein